MKAVEACCAACVALVGSAGARQQWVQVQETKLIGSDTNAADWLGTAVAIDGDTAIIGAPHADVNERGAAYVFVRVNGSWSQQAKLVAPSGTMDLDHFGASVAIQGDTAVVGAPDWNTNDEGRVFVFQRSGTTWGVPQELPGSWGDQFGTAVAIHNGYIAASAPWAGILYEGAIGIYTHSGSTWSQSAWILSGGDDYNLMGGYIALTQTSPSNYVLIASNDSGTASVYQGGGSSWTFVEPLYAQQGPFYGVCGVAASGTTLAIGLPGLNSSAGGVRIYTYVPGNATFQQQVQASDAAAGDFFGFSLALQGNVLIVGAPLHGDTLGPDIGRAYVFERHGTSWTQRALITPSDPGPTDNFATFVAVDDNTILLGSPYDSNGAGSTAGSAYVERIGFPSVNFCTAGVSNANCVVTMSSTGTPSASLATPFSIQANNVDGQRQGLVFYSTSGTYFAPWGPTSAMCLNQPLQRSLPQSSGGTIGACDGALTLDWNLFVAQFPTALGQPLAAGAQVWTQAWYRDPASFKTTQLSDALSFAVQP